MSAALVLLLFGGPSGAAPVEIIPGGGPVRRRRRRRREDKPTNEPSAPADAARYVDHRRVILPALGPIPGHGVTEDDIALILVLLEDE